MLEQVASRYCLMMDLLRWLRPGKTPAATGVVPSSDGGLQGLKNPDAFPEPDELDKEQIAQLHAATLQVSGNCFELKKLCATVLIASGTLVATFTDKKLDLSVFVAALSVTAIFWVADSQSYFIQAKLRRRMRQLEERRVNRHKELAGYTVDGVGLPIDPSANRWQAIGTAFFNSSMLYYALIATLVTLAWSTFTLGLIS